MDVGTLNTKTMTQRDLRVAAQTALVCGHPALARYLRGLHDANKQALLGEDFHRIQEVTDEAVNQARGV